VEEAESIAAAAVNQWHSLQRNCMLHSTALGSSFGMKQAHYSC